MYDIIGLISFLSGETPEPQKEDVDIRGAEVPSPFVDNLEELQTQLQQQPNQPAAQSSKEDTKKKKPSTTEAAPSTEIDISKLDIRVGVIEKAWNHPDADKLYCEEIDVGEEVPRQIASGLRAHYESADDLIGKRVLVLCNLKTRKLVGFPSHGMVLCAASDDSVQLVEPPADAVVGERMVVPGYEDGEPATENQVVKKKMLDAIFPDLATNDEGVACYKGIPFTTSAGPVLATDLCNVPVS